MKNTILNNLENKLNKGKMAVATLLLAILSLTTFATTTTFTTGSFIVNMGVTPQTYANGLKPYGLIYQLISQYKVPVSWVISQTKVKDGIDFTYSNVNYKGGTFIIPKEYIDQFSLTSVITTWTNQGVVGVYTTSALTVDVTQTLTYAPRWTIDASNSAVAVGYMTAAGITSANYGVANPSTLASCNDIYVLPHASPTWATHSNLYFWNKNFKGSIYSGCNSPSQLEGTMGVNPANSAQNMKFLTTDGMVLYSSHTGNTPPFSYYYPSDPAAQMMGIEDAAHASGMECVYLPLTSGGAGHGWNPYVDASHPGTHVNTTDPFQTNMPALSSGPAGITAWGRAFNDPTRGSVMYQSAHNLLASSNVAANVSAVREFFNWSFNVAGDKNPLVTGNTVPTTFTVGTASGSFTVTASSSYSTIATYSWTSSIGGTFSAPTAASTTFTPTASISNPTTAYITCRITDACGRVTILPVQVTISPNSLPAPTASSFSVAIPTNCSANPIVIDLTTHAVDNIGNGLTYAIQTNPSNGTFVNNNNGTFTYTPNANYTGTDAGVFKVTETGNPSLTATATISLTIGTVDGHGCYPSQHWNGSSCVSGIPTASAFSVDDSVNVSKVINVISGTPGSNASDPNNSQLFVSSITSQPTYGKVSINLDNGGTNVTYTPTIDDQHNDAFTAKICDKLGYCTTSTVTINRKISTCGAGKHYGSGSGVSAIAQVGTGSSAKPANSSNAFLSLSVPSGIHDGDIMFALISQGISLASISTANIIATAGSPSGSWNLIDSDAYAGGAQGSALFYKIANGETGATYKFPCQTTDATGGLVAFTNVDGTTPFDITPGTYKRNNSTSVTSNSISTVTNNDAVIMFVASHKSNGTSATPYSSAAISPNVATVNTAVNFGTTSANESSVGIFWGIQSASGSVSGSVTKTTNPVNSAVRLIALRAAANLVCYDNA
ncbi:MAG: Ig-like domain-containing protein, partial [Bacteroidota bacterium]